MNCVHGTVSRPGPSSVYRYSTVQYSTVQIYSSVYSLTTRGEVMVWDSEAAASQGEETQVNTGL